MQPVEILVVPGVYRDYETTGRQAVGQSQRQLGPANAARQGEDTGGSHGEFHGITDAWLCGVRRGLNCCNRFQASWEKPVSGTDLLGVPGMLETVCVQLDQPVVGAEDLFNVFPNQVQRVQFPRPAIAEGRGEGRRSSTSRRAPSQRPGSCRGTPTAASAGRAAHQRRSRCFR